MASVKINNRVQQTSTTTGTSDFQLIAPNADRMSFVTAVGSGDLAPYLAENASGTEWEYGIGTVTSGSPDQLARTTVIASSAGGTTKVTFSAGTKTIYLLLPAQMILWAGSSAAWDFTDIASATTTDIGSVNTLGANITGTTTITGFGSKTKTFRIVKFAGALTLTHNGTSLILKGGANRVTVAGDVGLYMSDASGNWRELAYFGYSEGTFTPTDGSGAGLSLTTSSGGAECKYTRSGRVVTLNFRINYPSTANGSTVVLSGLPFTAAGYGSGQVRAAATSGLLICAPGDTSLTAIGITNANLSSSLIAGTFTYIV